MTSNTHGRVAILLVASCYGNRDNLRPDGPLGSYADVFMCNVLKTRIKKKKKIGEKVKMFIKKCEMGKNVFLVKSRNWEKM